MMDGWVGGWMDGWMDMWVCGWVIDGWMMDGWIDGWMCGKWMNEKYTVRSRLTVEDYAAMKSSEVTQATAWMDPEHTLLSERGRHSRTHSV